MLELNDEIVIVDNGEKIAGQLIGIDTYCLESFSGKKCKWRSYTLISNRKDIFNRYWLVCWGKSEWILWLKSKDQIIPTDAELLLEKSGIAHIEFVGDAGISTPTAALAQFKVGEGYFCAERFLGSRRMFFSGKKIVKPEKAT